MGCDPRCPPWIKTFSMIFGSNIRSTSFSHRRNAECPQPHQTTRTSRQRQPRVPRPLRNQACPRTRHAPPPHQRHPAQPNRDCPRTHHAPKLPPVNALRLLLVPPNRGCLRTHHAPPPLLVPPSQDSLRTHHALRLPPVNGHRHPPVNGHRFPLVNGHRLPSLRRPRTASPTLINRRKISAKNLSTSATSTMLS